MTVTEVLATSVVIPLQTPTSFSTRTINERHYTLVKVRTDTGVEGLGFCYCGNGAGHIVTHAVRDLLAPIVVGRDAHQVEGAWDAMYRESLLMGRRGAVLRAISAIDTALWDAAAKAAELPLYRYLGAYHQDTVPAYASGGYYLHGKGVDGLAREVEGYVETGLRAVKIKVGGVSAREDAARIAAVRQAVGDDVEVMTDANNAWKDATSNATWVEFFTGTDVLNLMEVFKTRLRVKNGGLEIPQEPGLGVVLDDAAVERFSKDGWR